MHELTSPHPTAISKPLPPSLTIVLLILPGIIGGAQRYNQSHPCVKDRGCRRVGVPRIWGFVGLACLEDELALMKRDVTRLLDFFSE
jgi:hypothetical protein